MIIKCCKCGKEYDLGDNIFEYEKDTNCPILICPHCDFKHAINFMPFEKQIEARKAKKLDLSNPYFVILGASRIANASRVDQSNNDNGCVEAWGISSAIYSGKSKFIGSEDIYPRDVAFSPDGTKMYVMGDDNDTVYQYILSVAWDVDTAAYSGKSKYVGNEDDYPFGLAFSPDGTKMYIMGYMNNTAYQYVLSVAWDVDTAAYSGKSKDVREETGELTPYGIAFDSDGTKMYIVGFVYTTVFQFSLSVAWDINTATYPGKSKFLGSEDPSPLGITFSSDGAKMYIMGCSNGTVYQYTMPSSWVKTNDFILATRIYTSKGPIARAYKLRWRDVTDEGVFADVTDIGEITYSAVTDLIDDDDLLIDEKLCDEQGTGSRSPYTWQNGLESEGDNLLPDSGTYSLADEYYTEFQWALDCSNAEDEHEYEFELWDVTEGVSIGTCLARITMAALVIGLSMKWNGVAISKWNGVVINKLNGVD